MLRFLASLIFGFLGGLGAGVYFGWVISPVEFDNSPATALAQPFKDDYTVMIAHGYRVDADTISAVERLRVLGVDSIPDHVQNVTERYISGSRELDDIRALVALSQALGRMTPIMEPYRDISVPDGGTS